MKKKRFKFHEAGLDDVKTKFEQTIASGKRAKLLIVSLAACATSSSLQKKKYIYQ